MAPVPPCGTIVPVANKFYQAGNDRAQRVQALFAAIAPRYDFINDLQSLGLHRLWKRRLAKLSELTPGRTGLAMSPDSISAHRCSTSPAAV